MAENKKIVLVYTEWISIFNELTNEEAGKLIKHFFEYINDLNPVADDRLIKLLFEPIKMQLKRDLCKWEIEKVGKANAGKLGNLKRYSTDLYDKVLNKEISIEDACNIAKARTTSQSDICDRTPSHPIANLAVKVEVEVEDKVNDINTDTNVSCQTTPDEIETWKSLSKDKMSVHNFIKTRPKITEPYFEYWNQFAESYGKPRLLALTDKRKKKLKTRIKEPLFELNKILAKVKESEFIMSESWFTFDWIIESEANYMKVLEGNYSRKQITA
jgi:hypothetical protein